MIPTHTAVMTGASRGLGFHAAIAILQRDPKRHLLVTTRGDSKGELAQLLSAKSGNPNVTEIECDLSSLESVTDAAQSVQRLVDRGDVPDVDVLVANAGMQLGTTTRSSADGVELTYAVNVLANFAFIQALLPTLRVPGRIIITSSDTHFGDFRHNLGMIPAPHWRDPQLLSTPVQADDESAAMGHTAYSTSKLAVIYLVHALARRLPEGLDVYSFNPGLVPGTGLARDRDVLSRMGWQAVMPLLTATPLAMGARRAGRLLAAAATGPSPGPTGSYIDRRAVSTSSAESYDVDREERLWLAATASLELLLH